MSALTDLAGGGTAESIRQILDTNPDGVCVFDRELRYVYWNGVMEQIYGFREDEVLGQRAVDLFPFLTTGGEAECMRLALTGERAEHRDGSFSVLETGRGGFTESYYSPFYNSSGDIVGGVGIVRDMTERKETEARAHEVETRFHRMADSSPVLLWMAGVDGLCNFFNQTWLRFTGRTMEQELGMGWTEAIHPFDVERCKEAYLASFNAREPLEMEFRLMSAGGEYRWVLDRGSPRYTPGGEFAGFIGSCTDITERKNLETALSAALTKAEEASRAKSEFLANISHELRTPLNAIVNVPLSTLREFPILPVWRCDGCGGAFQKEEDGTDTGGADSVACPECGGHMAVRNEPYYVGDASKTVHFLQRLMQASQHLLRVVNDLLTFSKLDAGQTRLHLTEVDITGVLREVAQTMGPLAEEKGIRITYNELPAPIALRADAVKLAQIFINLIGNAIKFTEPGGSIAVGVQMETHQGIELLRGWVEDNGIGIPPDKQSAIFESFRQADGSHTRSHQGTGLGLTITRQLIELHGGRIWVESQVGKGSTFTFLIPRSPKVQDEKQPAARPLRVVAIDDSPVDLELVRSILEDAGCEVVPVVHPALAMHTIEETSPDCIILDVMMPDLSGLTLLRQFKASASIGTIPVLVSTAYHNNREVVQRLGGIWVPKPWSRNELLSCIRKHTGWGEEGAPALRAADRTHTEVAT